jgi:hypothetical protein
VDNGYGSQFPDEKEYVVENLSAVKEKFAKDASISFAYIRKRALEPLGTLIERFGKASIGILAEAAKAVLKDWLQKRGITFLDEYL